MLCADGADDVDSTALGGRELDAAGATEPSGPPAVAWAEGPVTTGSLPAPGAPEAARGAAPGGAAAPPGFGVPAPGRTVASETAGGFSTVARGAAKIPCPAGTPAAGLPAVERRADGVAPVAGPPEPPAVDAEEALREGALPDIPDAGG